MFKLGIRYFFSSFQRSRLRTVLRLTVISLSINIGAFVVAFSLMRGFQTEVMSKLLHVHGHANLYPFIQLPKSKASKKFTIIEKLPNFLKSPALKLLNLMHVPAPSLEKVIKKAQAQCILKYGALSRPIIITATEDSDAKYIIGKNLKAGQVDFQKVGDVWPIVIGSKLAELGCIDLNTEVNLIISSQVSGEIKKVTCRVVGVFDFGFYEFDKGMIFSSRDLITEHFPESQDFGVVYIDQLDRIDEYIESVKNLKEDLMIESWKEIYRSIEDMFKTHAIGITLLLGMFVISGVVQSISSLSILMSDRAYDISVLTMFGMSKFQKYTIFITYGILVSITNVFFGVTGGIAFSLFYPRLRDAIEDFTAIKLIDPNSFWISTFDTKILLSDIGKITIGSLLVMIIAMLIGSYFVIKLENTEGIKD